MNLKWYPPRSKRLKCLLQNFLGCSNLVDAIDDHKTEHQKKCLTEE